MKKFLVCMILVMGLTMVGCSGKDTPGTVVNNSGDNNNFVTGSKGISITNPTPVVVPPVFAPEPQKAEGAGD